MKNKKSVLFIVSILVIYFIFYYTGTYTFNWKEKKYLGNEGVKIFFISNPPKDKLDLLNMTVGHIKKLRKTGTLINIKEIAYIKETWLTNRFYNFNEDWDSEKEWQFARSDVSLQIYSSNFDINMKDTKGCIDKLDPYNLNSGFYSNHLPFNQDYSFWRYFLNSVDKTSKKHWVRLNFKNNEFSQCDTLSIPEELIKNKNKWKNLERN
jgi:hypothetical protein